MRTEDDIRHTLRQIAQDTPTAEEFRPRLHLVGTAPHRPARRLLAVGAVAAAVVAVAVAIPAAVPDRRSGPPAGTPAPAPAAGRCSAGPNVAWMCAFWIDRDVPGYVLRETRSTAQSSKVAIFTSPDSYLVGYAEVWRPHVFDPKEARRGQPVSVGGRSGFYGLLTRLDQQPGSSAIVPTKAKTPALAWQYGPDAWVVVQSGLPTHVSAGIDFRALALKVAAVIHPNVSVPLPVPVKLGFVPPGLVPNDVTSAQGLSGVTAGQAGARIMFAGRAGRLSVRAEIPDHNLFTPYGLRVDVNGHQGWLRRTSDRLPSVVVLHQATLQVIVGRWLITVDASYEIPTDQILGVARHLTLAADPDDLSTWFEAATALP